MIVLLGDRRQEVTDMSGIVREVVASTFDEQRPSR